MILTLLQISITKINRSKSEIGQLSDNFVLYRIWYSSFCSYREQYLTLGFAQFLPHAILLKSWFFTWATCFLVMETLLWFISDSREGLHQTLIEKEDEYRQHQLNVLATAHGMLDESSDLHSRYDDAECSGDDGTLTIELKDPPQLSKSAVGRAATFEMKDESENDDDIIQQEIRMKEKDRNAYFDNLDDILE